MEFRIVDRNLDATILIPDTSLAAQDKRIALKFGCKRVEATPKH
jgi:hypothetical protein